MTSIRGIVRVALLASAGLALPACKGSDPKAGAGKDPSADRAIPVVATPVVQRDMPIYLDGLGNVIAYETVTVHTQVDGRLDQLAFREGQEVHKGDAARADRSAPLPDPAPHGRGGAGPRSGASSTGPSSTSSATPRCVKDSLIPSSRSTISRRRCEQLRGHRGGATEAADRQRPPVSSTTRASPRRSTASPASAWSIRATSSTPAIRAASWCVTQLDPIAVIFTLPQDDLRAIAQELAAGALDGRGA